MTLILICYRCDMEEKKDEEESTLNEGEAEVAISHAKRLIHAGVHASDIGIITPYAAQVRRFYYGLVDCLVSMNFHFD